MSAEVTVDEAVPTIEEQIVSAGTALADVPAQIAKGIASSTGPSEIAPADGFVPAEEEIPETDIDAPAEAEVESEAATAAENEEVVLPESTTTVQDPVVRPAETDTRTPITGTAFTLQFLAYGFEVVSVIINYNNLAHPSTLPSVPLLLI